MSLAVLSFALLALAGTADAGTKKDFFDVNWRQQRDGAFRDSSSARALGSAAPTSHDTSGAIPLQMFVIPDKGTGQLPTASDSLSWLRIDYFPISSSPTAAADSIHLTVQVSPDGVANWVNATPTSVFLTTADGGVGAVVLEQGTTNAFYYVLRQRVGAVASGDLMFPLRSSSTAPTFQELFGWPYMRIIVQSDRTGAYDARISGFISSCD